MEQTPHGENPFPAHEPKGQDMLKNKPMLFGILALVIVTAGVIWYISDTSISTAVPPLPQQNTTQNGETKATDATKATVAVPLANSAELPTIELSLSEMEANLRTIDDLKDI